MARLPQPGADNDAWGQLLNDFLRVEHNEDGTHRSGVFNALTFGARGDGVADDTPAIQATLDAAAACGGVAWLAPAPSFYRCQGTLTVPQNVTLKGGFGGMRRGHKLWNEDPPCGSVLYAYNPDNFITMNHNATLDGVEIFYPEQVTSGEPRPYGWTILIPRHQHGVTVRNVTCPNPYQFLYAEADGLWIDGVQGYPLLKGIKMGRVGDVARISNIHFNPNALPRLDMSLRSWVQTQGCCLEIDAAEEFMIHNFFGYGYVCGIWFTGQTQDELPGSYGSIGNFGFDSVTVGILIGTKGVSGRQGLSLSNGRIIPFAGPVGARAGIKFIDDLGVDPASSPAVSLTNVSFFGAHERSIWIGPRSGARLTMLGGQCTEYQNEAVLVESGAAAVRLIGVRTFNGKGPRIQNTGGADVGDLGGMSGATMTRIKRRQFLILALGFTGTLTLPKAIPIATAIGRPPRMVRPPRAYGVRGYGQGAYGSTEVSAPAEGVLGGDPLQNS